MKFIVHICKFVYSIVLAKLVEFIVLVELIELGNLENWRCFVGRNSGTMICLEAPDRQEGWWKSKIWKKEEEFKKEEE